MYNYSTRGTRLAIKNTVVTKQLFFLKTALCDYRVGAVLPSTRRALRRVLTELPRECRYVVEYGPGDGVSTRAILERLPPDGRVVAIERNPDFLPRLWTIDDGRLRLMLGDVRAISTQLDQLGLPRIDAVISSIPFSFLSNSERENIVERTAAALAPAGRFIVYQYSPLMLRYLRRAFTAVRVRFALRNVPPYFIMVAEKSPSIQTDSRRTFQKINPRTDHELLLSF